MSITETESAESRSVPADTLGARPGWYAAWGVLSVVAGLIAMGAAFWATVATVLIFAVLLLLSGVAQIAEAFATRDRAGFAWRLGIGILTTIAGGLIVADPISGAIGLTFLIAMFFVFAGILKIILAGQLETVGRGWFLTIGILDLLLGLLIALQWPASGIWVIGLFIGIDLVLIGFALVFLAVQASKVRSA